MLYYFCNCYGPKWNLTDSLTTHSFSLSFHVFIHSFIQYVLNAQLKDFQHLMKWCQQCPPESSNEFIFCCQFLPHAHPKENQSNVFNVYLFVYRCSFKCDFCAYILNVCKWYCVKNLIVLRVMYILNVYLC